MRTSTAVVIAAASLLLALPGRASAQPGMTPVEPAEAPPAPADLAAPQSPGVALALSLGGTITGWAFFLGSEGITDNPDTEQALVTVGGLGVMLAPSAGHWYAGKIFTRGMGLRAAGAASVLAGLTGTFSDCPLFTSGGCGSTTNVVLFLIGGALVVGGTIDDIVSAPFRVMRRNRERAGVAITPVVTRDAAGLALGGQF